MQSISKNNKKGCDCVVNLKTQMIEKVQKCLETHVGGEAYFNELDAAIKSDKEFLKSFINCIIEETNCHNFVMSGEIGSVYFKLCSHDDIRLLLLPGGLRHGKELPHDVERIYKGMEFVFVDDSYYSGKTLNAVKKYIESTGAKIIANYVFYDGSRENKDNMKSIYRYYDYH
jgi:hypothetical protein